MRGIVVSVATQCRVNTSPPLCYICEAERPNRRVDNEGDDEGGSEVDTASGAVKREQVLALRATTWLRIYLPPPLDWVEDDAVKLVPELASQKSTSQTQHQRPLFHHLQG